MNLEQLPKQNYTNGETPIEKLKVISKELNGPNILIKRDDLLIGLAEGGNKIRKLEYVMADALANKADTIITCGAVQSNHCRLTLAAAVKEKLKCKLVLEERVPNSYKAQASGNNLLYQLLGVDEIQVVKNGTDLMIEMQKMADKVRSEGGTPYIIPGGASNEIGSTGYVSCAQEILKQMEEENLNIDYIVCASGSGGTHAGLLAGLHGSMSDIPVIGINVRAEKDIQEQKIYELANKTIKYLAGEGSISKERVNCFDNYVGAGYSLPTDEMIEAIRLLAKTEGILLDPVYSGKAMAGLIDLIRKNHFKKEDNVLFIHTGGVPALYASEHLFLA